MVDAHATGCVTRTVSAGSTSNTIQFMPGPTQLGKNVLRVDVDKGIFPTTKGPEYSGEATLSVDGGTQHDHVAGGELRRPRQLHGQLRRRSRTS